jgi:Cof subfamily protein (haloacid dehalogenase superfamily)
MQYKLIALDLDGTLLNDAGKIDGTNITAIKKAGGTGVKTIITTGRSYASAKKYIRLIDAQAPSITYNGAVIQKDNKILRKITLKGGVIQEILKLLNDMDYAPIIYLADNHKYYETFGKYTDDFLDFSKDFERELIRVDNIFEKKWEGVIRLSIITGEPDIPLLHSALKNRFMSEIKTIDTFFADWNFWVFEILDSRCSKSKGLNHLCGMYNIQREEVIAVGDNNNDLDMITWAGLGVAMKNGLNNVLREADYVTEKSNNENGVAEVIEKFILNA